MPRYIHYTHLNRYNLNQIKDSLNIISNVCKANAYCSEKKNTSQTVIKMRKKSGSFKNALDMWRAKNVPKCLKVKQMLSNSVFLCCATIGKYMWF